MVLTDAIQLLIDADWYGTVDEARAAIIAEPGLRLFGPVDSPELQPGTHEVAASWPDTGQPWPATAVISGSHDLDGAVLSRVVQDRATSGGCPVQLDVSRPIPAGAFRFAVLAAERKAR